MLPAPRLNRLFVYPLYYTLNYVNLKASEKTNGGVKCFYFKFSFIFLLNFLNLVLWLVIGTISYYVMVSIYLILYAYNDCKQQESFGFFILIFILKSYILLCHIYLVLKIIYTNLIKYMTKVLTQDLCNECKNSSSSIILNEIGPIRE